MSNIQSVSIIAAFPSRAVITLIAVSFLKDAGESALKGLRGYTPRGRTQEEAEGSMRHEESEMIGRSNAVILAAETSRFAPLFI